jgi:integrase
VTDRDEGRGIVPIPPTSFPTLGDYGTEAPPHESSDPTVSPSVPSPARSRKRKVQPKAKNPYGARYGIQRVGELALTPTEVESLLMPIDVLAERALLEVAISTGIRREDLVAIPRVNFEPDSGRLAFREAKKHREREIYLTGRALVTIRTHVRTLAPATEFLFPSPRATRSRRRHLSGRYAYDVLQKWLDRAKLRRRPFHSLRATAYKLAKARGWSVEQAAALIGDTIRVAMEFYGVATPGELREIAIERPLI